MGEQRPAMTGKPCSEEQSSAVRPFLYGPDKTSPLEMGLGRPLLLEIDKNAARKVVGGRP
jgi:hypothetical protein